MTRGVGGFPGTSERQSMPRVVDGTEEGAGRVPDHPAATPPDESSVGPSPSVPGVGSSAVDVTVIVPTRNEAGNVAPLLGRLGAALEGSPAQVLFVDDSDDDTPSVIEREGATSPLQVVLLHRPPGQRHGGLGGAVLAGLQAAQAPVAVVMDGDLQHPPELVPELVRVAHDESADVVVASRHVAGGSSAGLAGRLRFLVSDGATSMTKLAFPRRLAGVTDPMSGFFLVRTGAVDLAAMRPTGFKILLELLVRTPGLSTAEVPMTFAERHSGESKASFVEGVRFLRLVARLSTSRVWAASRRRAAKTEH
jgi:dolichol-phosphate mannosyltransferase